MKKNNLSDWLVALAVVVSSAVLFGALAVALNGTMLSKPAFTLKVNFHDITGVRVGSRVKFGGATAGNISAIRILSLEERSASGDPLNVVQATLAFSRGVPPITEDSIVTVSADTLLSDKFLLVSGGSPQSAVLPDGAVIQGITPVSFDQLVRNVDQTIEGVRVMLGGTDNPTGALMAKVEGLLTQTASVLEEVRGLVGNAQPVLTDAKSLITQASGVLTDADNVVERAGTVMVDAGGLISENRQPIKRTVAQLEKAAGSLDRLAVRGDKLVKDSEPTVSKLLSDFQVTGENLKVTATFARILLRSLNERPSRLIWGGRGPELPTEQEILQSSELLRTN